MWKRIWRFTQFFANASRINLAVDCILLKPRKLFSIFPNKKRLSVQAMAPKSWKNKLTAVTNCFVFYFSCANINGLETMVAQFLYTETGCYLCYFKCNNDCWSPRWTIIGKLSAYIVPKISCFWDNNYYWVREKEREKIHFFYVFQYLYLCIFEFFRAAYNSCKIPKIKTFGF